MADEMELTAGYKEEKEIQLKMIDDDEKEEEGISAVQTADNTVDEALKCVCVP